MRKIRWTTRKHSGKYTARVGNIELVCCKYGAGNWTSTAKFRRIQTEGQFTNWTLRFGQERKTCEEAKAEAVKLAEEMLIDAYVSIRKEMDGLSIETDIECHD